MDDSNLSKKSVVLFIPEAGIYAYLRALSVLGNAAKKEGSNVFVTRCTGEMFRCPMMVMHRIPVDITKQEKEKFCKKCTNYFGCAQRRYGFSTIDFSLFVSSQLMNEINDAVSHAGENLESVIFRGFPVGKMAQYDFILETKYPYSSNFSEAHKAIYSAYIKNCALAVAISDNICQLYKPALLLTFNEYGQGQAARFGAKINNVSRMAVTNQSHLNIDFSRFAIWASTHGSWTSAHCQKWNEKSDISITAQSVNLCWSDIIFRLYGIGSHIFSLKKKKNPATIFERFKLNTKRKTIVVYTSSQDERKCTETAAKIWDDKLKIVDAFSNQIDWLNMLQDYANQKEDVQIVVRIHPREGARQFGFDSHHLKQLKEKFKSKSERFYIVWPDDDVSSYDLLELADFCLVSWSTMGQEATRLGIPSLACTGNLYYPDDDFIQVATTKEEYRKRLDAMINFDFTWKHLLKAVRFYHWRTFVPSLDLGETVPVDIENSRVWPEAPESKVKAINDIFFGKTDLIEYNIEQWKKTLPKNAVEQESEAMRLGIRRFINKVFYPRSRFDSAITFYRKAWRKFIGSKVPFLKMLERNPEDYILEFSTDATKSPELCEKTKINKNLRILLADGLDAVLIRDGKMLRRMSPMIIRLAKLHASSLQE